jgi:2,4-dichlorophenol 6-monooxygenase
VPASPCTHADLAQDLLEPVLLRGAHVRFDTDYLHCTQDAQGVTATVQDSLTKETYQIRAAYLLGADGGGSKIVLELGLPLVGQMNFSNSINIGFEADLTAYVAHRPALLYFIVRTGLDAGGMGLGFLRPFQRWHRWQFTKGYLLGQRNEQLTHAEAAALIRGYLGLPELAVRITSIAPWVQNSLYATQYRQGRFFLHGRRRASPQPVQRPGLEYVDAGCLQPGLEAGAGAARPSSPQLAGQLRSGARAH